MSTFAWQLMALVFSAICIAAFVVAGREDVDAPETFATKDPIVDMASRQQGPRPTVRGIAAHVERVRATRKGGSRGEVALAVANLVREANRRYSRSAFAKATAGSAILITSLIVA